MKLRDGLDIKKVGEYYFFNFKNQKVKKITSRMMPILLGLSDFSSIGYGILERANMLVFEQIEEFYQVRGSIGEIIASHLVKDLYKGKYKVDVDLKIYSPEQFKGYDMFNSSYNWGDEDFGGVPDMVISKPSEYRTLFEVKTKNIKSYEWIVDKGLIPQEELYQAYHLGYLSKTPKVSMVYVFFTDEQEEKIKHLIAIDVKKPQDIIDQLELTYRNTKIKIFTYDLDRADVFLDMQASKLEIDTAVSNGKIHKTKFRADELMILDDYIDKMENKGE